MQHATMYEIFKCLRATIPNATADSVERHMDSLFVLQRDALKFIFTLQYIRKIRPLKMNTTNLI